MSETRIIVPERGYFSLPRNAAQDERLTLETRGLLALMLSLPHDWDYTVSGLAVKAGCGREKMRRMLRELEGVGYLAREQTHDGGGQFAGNVYVLQETPPSDGFSGNGDTENPTVAQKPRQREKPSTAEPSTAFRPEQIIDRKIIDINTPPIIPPQGERRERSKRAKKHETKYAPDWKPERFTGFWGYYPRHENPQGAVAAWDSLKPSDELIDTIARALEKLKATEGWQRGIGIPHAATFLNAERWRDAECALPAPTRGQPPRRINTPQEDGGDGSWVDL